MGPFLGSSLQAPECALLGVPSHHPHIDLASSQSPAESTSEAVGTKQVKRKGVRECSMALDSCNLLQILS